MPEPEGLPSVDELLSPAPGDGATAASGGGQPSPARAEPHDATAWLPLPELDGLPEVHELLQPAAVGAATAEARDIAVAPSPARAEPHDATAWLPLPDAAGLPDITELVEPDVVGAEPPDARPRKRTRLLPATPARRVLLGGLAAATIVASFFGFQQVTDGGADVDLQVDGRVISAETGVSTVGSFLDEQRVELSDFDRVTPGLESPIENEMTVRVFRAFPVTVDVDGQVDTVQTTFSRPQDFLRSQKLAETIVFRDPPTHIAANASVVLRTKKSGTLLLDGTATNYESPSHTVRELLEDYNVVLGPADFTGPVGIDDVLPDNASIALVRVGIETVQADEPYALPDEEQDDPNILVGETRVQEAVPGILRRTYQVTRHDGVEAGRSLISEVPVQPAQPRITFHGTKADPVWDRMAQCETGGNWSAPGPTYQGGLGIYYANWNHYGGLAFAPSAGQATREQQIIVAERIRAEHGLRAWGCARTIGY